MKRFLVLLVVGFFSLQASFAQMVVADAAVAALFDYTKFEQVKLYYDMIKNGADQIILLKDQLEKSTLQLQAAIQNMRGLKDVDSWDGFKDWYNRQLYLEKSTIESVKGMNVTIGKKNYSLWDLEGIRDGVNDTYVEYWNKEFTEEQRREMWLSLGLTPENYAYVQPYRVKGREVAREMIALTHVQHEKNLKYSEVHNKNREDIKKDSTLPEDKQMGDKELQQRILLSMDTATEVLEDISEMTAKQLEAQGIDKYTKETPVQSQQMSTWTVKLKPLKK